MLIFSGKSLIVFGNNTVHGSRNSTGSASHTHTHTHTHTYIYTYIHTHTHTGIRVQHIYSWSAYGISKPGISALLCTGEKSSATSCLVTTFDVILQF
jgi:hypothetical protein